MGIYIFNYKTLRKYLVADLKNAESNHDFGKDIIPAYLNDGKNLLAYRFKGYWKDVGTIDSLWEANMDLLEEDELDLSDSGWKIYTENKNAVPQYVGSEGSVENCYIKQGVKVFGDVNHSVLGSNCTIGKGAKVVDSVIMPGVHIGEGATVTRCIVADNVEIGAGVKVGDKNSEHILLVAKNTK